MNILEIQERARVLKEKTQAGSITPDEVGGLIQDLATYASALERAGAALGIRKTYTTISAMNADSQQPVDENGISLKRGMLVNIFNPSDLQAADNGKVYKFLNPGWELTTVIGTGKTSSEAVTLPDGSSLEKWRSNIWSSARFNGITDKVGVPSSIGKVIAPEHVYYSSPSKAFVFEDGGKYYAASTNSYVYNEGPQQALANAYFLSPEGLYYFDGKELVAVSTSGGGSSITGFKYVESVDQLPASPSEEEKTLGYIIGTDMYLYVGTGGDTLGGKYKNVGPFKGKDGVDGNPGEKGEQGNTGSSVDYPFELVNNLTEGGIDKALSADQGRLIGNELYGITAEKPLEYTLKSGFINELGVVQSSSAYSYTSDIQIEKGEELIVQSTGTGFSVISISENGRYIPVISAKNTGATSTSIYRYKSPQNTFVSVCGRTDSPYRITIERVPMSKDGLVGAVSELKEEIAEVKLRTEVQILKDFCPSFQYGRIGSEAEILVPQKGYYIGIDGKKKASNSYGITDAILVNRGDSIFVHTRGNEFCVIAETNKEGTAYTALINKRSGAGPEASIFRDFYYNPERTMYVAICVLMEGEEIRKIKSSGGIVASEVEITSEPIDVALNEQLEVETSINNAVVISSFENGSYIPLVAEVRNTPKKNKTYTYTNDSEKTLKVAICASAKGVLVRKKVNSISLKDNVTFLSDGYSNQIEPGSYLKLAILGDGQYRTDDRSRSVVIPLRKGFEYTITKEQSNRNRIAITESYPNMDGGTYRTLRFWDTFSPFTAQDGEKFAIIMVSNESEEPVIEISQSQKETKEENNGTVQRNSVLDCYEHPQGLPDLSASLSSANHQVVYDIFNTLKEQYPDYVTIKTAGQSLGQQDIMAVEISTPHKMVNDTKLKKKRLRVYIIASIHGYEQMAGYALAKYVEDILTNSNVVNNLLREYIDYFLIPVANPDGFDKNSRYNNNGVDLNRNFAEGWIRQGGGHYSGTGPNSEPETNVVIDYGSSIGDYSYYFDIHNIGDGFSCDPVFYVNEQKFADYGEEFFTKLSAFWIHKYNLTGDKAKVYGRVSDNPKEGTSLEEMTKDHGIGCVLETPWTIPFSDRKYDKKTLETSVDIIGNLMLLLVKDYNKGIL